MNRSSGHNRLLSVCLLWTLIGLPSNASTEETLSDSEIRALMVLASIAAYSGACPCPETLTSAGRRCGDSSAYRQRGGNRPLCSDADVTAEMIERYRRLTATSVAGGKPSL
jgi:hypothetical protein